MAQKGYSLLRTLHISAAYGPIATATRLVDSSSPGRCQKRSKWQSRARHSAREAAFPARPRARAAEESCDSSPALDSRTKWEINESKIWGNWTKKSWKDDFPLNTNTQGITMVSYGFKVVQDYLRPSRWLNMLNRSFGSPFGQV